jgi:hypothetical protein
LFERGACLDPSEGVGRILPRPEPNQVADECISLGQIIAGGELGEKGGVGLRVAGRVPERGLEQGVLFGRIECECADPSEGFGGIVV